jgi:phage conserved hypothetical protein, phiE125 gp8 family
MLIRLSNPSGLAVTLAEVKAALRVSSDDDDALLQSLIQAETLRYEDFTGRVMLPTDFEYRFDIWRIPLQVPVVPLREVAELSYLDEDGAETLVAPSHWYVVKRDDGFDVYLTNGFEVPALSDQPQSVRVRFLAGHDEPGVSGSGDDPELAPVAQDQINIIRMVQRIYDRDELMPDEEMIRTMGNRRIFR